MQLQINVGPELFRFDTYATWNADAKRRFDWHGVHSSDTVCIDSQGRICRIGRDFARAYNDGAFPVVVYRLVEE